MARFTDVNHFTYRIRKMFHAIHACSKLNFMMFAPPGTIAPHFATINMMFCLLHSTFSLDLLLLHSTFFRINRIFVSHFSRTILLNTLINELDFLNSNTNNVQKEEDKKLVTVYTINVTPFIVHFVITK